MKKGYLYIIMCAFLFSTMELAGKMVAGQLGSMQVTFIRFSIGCAVLMPFAVRDIRKRNLRLGIADIIYFAALGALCVPVSMVLLQLSVKYAKASTAAVVFSINPIFTIPFAMVILKERVDKATLASVLISIAGVALIFNPFGGSYSARGLAIALGAAIAFAAYTVLSKLRLSVYGGFVFNFFTFLSGNIILWVVMSISGGAIIEGVDSGNISVLLYMGIAITGFGYIFFLKAIEETSPVKASTVFLIKPALAPILSLLILKESISINVWAGILLIIAGAVTGCKSKKSGAKAEKSA